VRWYRLAADQGYAEAQVHLGRMYSNGRGVPEDDAEAVRWHRLAADQGHASGQNNLGVMYVDGRGVPQDYVLAHMWFNLAAAGSNGDRHINNRDRAAEELTPDDLSEAQRLAREWDAAHPREPEAVIWNRLPAVEWGLHSHCITR
jgi:TPR repeat protein